jgi:hypothetical protein
MSAVGQIASNRVESSAEFVCRRAQRIVRKVRVALRRLRLGVAQQTSHDGKALPGRDKMRSIGVPQIVQAHIAKARFGLDIGPEFLDIV